MEPSEEIRRVIERWMVAMPKARATPSSGGCLIDPGILAIGTDADEWWRGHERAVWRHQLEETGGFPVTWEAIEAWEEGTRVGQG